EAIGVQEGEEELEVLFLPGMRRRGHEQEVAGDTSEHFAEAIPAGLLELVTEEVRRHAVRLVHDDEIPFTASNQIDEIVIARKMVEPGDEEVVVGERVRRAACLDQISGEDRELEPEPVTEFVLPLADQPTRGDHEATLQ